MSQPSNPNYHQLITESMLIIERGLLHEINIDSLIENHPLPNDEYLHYFIQFSHETPHAYQNRLRTEYALLLLLLGKATIEDVHTKAAFSDHNDFLESFLKRFHQDPLDMVNKQRLQHDLISFHNKPLFGISNKDDILTNLDSKITITECEPIEVQCLRNIGPYKKTYKPWLGLIYRAGTKLALAESTKQIGMTLDFPSITHKDHLRYEACIHCDKKVSTLTLQIIEGGLYATYLHQEGPSSLDDKISELLCIWLPNSEYQLRLRPLYYNYENFGKTAFTMNQIKITVFIPIEKKL